VCANENDIANQNPSFLMQKFGMRAVRLIDFTLGNVNVG